MPQGLELRTVINNADASQMANQPIRQVAVPGVSTPSVGDFSQVGAKQEAMAELFKLGGTMLGKYAEKRKAEDEMRGKMMYAQGRTELELDELGVSRATRDAYTGLQTSDNANRMFLELSAAIDTEDYQLDPETYREKMLGKVRPLLDGIDPTNPAMAGLVDTVASDMVTKLSAAHYVRHNEHNKKQSKRAYSDLVRSSVLAGEPDQATDLIQNAKSYLPYATDDEVDEVKFEALRSSMDEGDLTLFNKVGGLTGLREMGASEPQINAVLGKLKDAQGMNEQANLSRIEQEINVINRMVKSGELAPELAAEQIKEVQEQFELNPDWAVGNVKAVFNTATATEEMKRTLDILSNPEYTTDVKELLSAVSLGSLDEKMARKLGTDLSNRHGLDLEQSVQLFQAIRGASNSSMAKQVAEVEQTANQQRIKQEKEQRAMSAAENGFTGIHSPEELELGFAAMRGKIASTIMADASIPDDEKQDAMREGWVSYLAKIPAHITDPVTKANIQTAFQLQPTEPGSSKVRTEVVDALNTLLEMKDQGLSQRSINSYIGTSNREYIDTALTLMEGGDDPSTALQTAFDMVERGKTAPSDKAKGTLLQAQQLIKDQPTRMVEYYTPNILSAWLGGPATVNRDDVLTSDLKRAAANSDELSDYLTKQARVKLLQNPNMTSEAAVQAAMRESDKFVFVAGSLVAPNHKGKSMAEAMQVEHHGPMAAHKALVEYIRENKDLVFPPGSSEGDAYAGWIDSISSSFGKDADNFKRWWFRDDSVDIQYKTNWDKFAESAYWMSPMGLSEAALPENYQKLKNGLEYMDVKYVGDDTLTVTLYKDAERTNASGTVQLSARKLGEYFNNKVNKKINEEATKNAWFKQ